MASLRSAVRGLNPTSSLPALLSEGRSAPVASAAHPVQTPAATHSVEWPRSARRFAASTRHLPSLRCSARVAPLPSPPLLTQSRHRRPLTALNGLAPLGGSRPQPDIFPPCAAQRGSLRSRRLRCSPSPDTGGHSQR